MTGAADNYCTNTSLAVANGIYDSGVSITPRNSDGTSGTAVTNSTDDVVSLTRNLLRQMLATDRGRTRFANMAIDGSGHGDEYYGPNSKYGDDGSGNDLFRSNENTLGSTGGSSDRIPLPFVAGDTLTFQVTTTFEDVAGGISGGADTTIDPRVFHITLVFHIFSLVFPISLHKVEKNRLWLIKYI